MKVYPVDTLGGSTPPTGPERSSSAAWTSAPEGVVRGHARPFELGAMSAGRNQILAAANHGANGAR